MDESGSRPSHRRLSVWMEACDLAAAVYLMCRSNGAKLDAGLVDQLRRAAVSVPSNIAEGDERGSNRDSIRFLYIARGSAAELATQLEIAHDIGALTPTEYQSTHRRLYSVNQLLGGTIRMRQERLRKEERQP